jgi:hypothetical protein
MIPNVRRVRLVTGYLTTNWHYVGLFGTDFLSLPSGGLIYPSTSDGNDQL